MHEPDETLELILSVSSANSVLGANSKLLVTLHNSPTELSLQQIGSNDRNGTVDVEESFGATKPLLEIVRRGDRDSEASVALEFMDASEDPRAIPGVDYLPLRERITLLPGETSKAFNVPIIDDGVIDDAWKKFFSVRLVNPLAGTTISKCCDSRTIGIEDNEIPTHLDVTHSPEAERWSVPLVLLGIREGGLGHGNFQKLGNGKTLVFGYFHFVNGVPRPSIARLDADGELDQSFVPPADLLSSNVGVDQVFVSQSGPILIRTTENQFVLLRPDGTKDTAEKATPLLNGPPREFRPATLGPDATIWFASGGRVFRVAPDGMVLVSAWLGDNVHALLTLSDGSTFVGMGCSNPDDGNFGDCLRKLRPDLTFDPGFAPIHGRLLRQLSDRRMVVLSGIQVQLFHPTGALDNSLPPLTIDSSQDGPSFWPPTGDKPYLDASVTHVKRMPVPEWPPVRLRLSNLPNTSLQLSAVDGLGTPWVSSRNWRDEAELEAVGFSSFSVRFRRLGTTTTPATVRYITRDITATAGKDYVAQSGTITFAPLETEKVIQILILPDTEDEFDETLEVVVTGAEGFEALPAPMRLTIISEKGAPPRLERVKRLRDGRVLLGGTGPQDTSKLEFSSDLKTWHPLNNLLGGLNGESPTWLDASATNAPTRYYRAVAR